jgi:hypothetical protein
MGGAEELSPSSPRIQEHKKLYDNNRDSNIEELSKEAFVTFEFFMIRMHSP